MIHSNFTRYAALVTVGLLVILAAACEGNPTTPSATTINGAPITSLGAGKATANMKADANPPVPTNWYVPDAAKASAYDTLQFGHTRQTNVLSQSACWTFVWWDRHDVINQVMLKQQTQCLAPGQIAEYSVGLATPCLGQRDAYLNLPKHLTGESVQFTKNEVDNYQYTGDNNVAHGDCTRTPPPCPDAIGCSPPPPPPPSCVVLCDPPPPSCSGADTLNFPPMSYMATFPAGFPAPWYPSELGPFTFSIPAGTWHLVAVTGDNHLGKPDEPMEPMYQAHEQGVFQLFACGAAPIKSTGSTLDIPPTQDSITSDLGLVELPVAITSVKVVHAFGPTDPPDNSFYPVSLTYSCPSSVTTSRVRARGAR